MSANGFQFDYTGCSVEVRQLESGWYAFIYDFLAELVDTLGPYASSEHAGNDARDFIDNEGAVKCKQIS